MKIRNISGEGIELIKRKDLSGGVVCRGFGSSEDVFLPVVLVCSEEYIEGRKEVVLDYCVELKVRIKVRGSWVYRVFYKPVKEISEDFDECMRDSNMGIINALWTIEDKELIEETEYVYSTEGICEFFKREMWKFIMGEHATMEEKMLYMGKVVVKVMFMKRLKRELRKMFESYGGEMGYCRLGDEFWNRERREISFRDGVFLMDMCGEGVEIVRY